MSGGLKPNQNKKVLELLGVDSLAKDLLPGLIEFYADDPKQKRLLEIRQEFAASSLAKYETAMPLAAAELPVLEQAAFRQTASEEAE